MEESFESLQGPERFDALYRWLEIHSGDQPQKTLSFGREAIALMPQDIEPSREAYLYVWTATGAFFKGQMDVAGEMSAKASAIGREIKDEVVEFDALIIQTSAATRRGSYQTAAGFGARLKKIAPNPLGALRVHTALALNYRLMGDLPAAQDEYLVALDLCGRTEECEQYKGTIFVNLGRIFNQLGQIEEAIAKTEEGLAIVRAHGQDRISAHVLFNLGTYRAQQGHYERALEHFEESLSILNRLGDEGEVNIYNLAGMATTLAELGRIEEAQRSARLAVDLAEAKENPKWLLKAQIANGQTLRLIGLLPESEQQLEKALDLAEEIDLPLEVSEILASLSDVYEEQGNYKAALSSYRRGTEADAQLLSEKNQRLFNEWRARVDAGKAELELAESISARKIQETELQKQLTMRNALAIVVGILLLSAIGLTFSYRQQTRALSQVKLLSGMLPICASCKSIRDDQGYWTMVEEYITDHSEARFSHGICPDCFEENFPELRERSRKTLSTKRIRL